ncbi:MAG: T9SS type A sorting domain-containing protein [Ignavibacteriaceae bacterium]
MNSFFTNITKKIFILVIIILSPVYSQTVLFNNLDKVINSYSTELRNGQQFKTTASLRFITEVELGIFRGSASGDLKNFTVAIYFDDGSNQKGDKLVDLYANSDNSVLSPDPTSTFTINEANSNMMASWPVELEADTKYWIGVHSSIPNAYHWNYTAEDLGSGDGFLARNFVGEDNYFDEDPLLLKILANNVLPVELNSFSSCILDNNVKLNWQTATEVNNYGFEVERSLSSHSSSLNGHSLSAEWEMIGFVAGSGNSNAPKSYSFKDNTPRIGKVLYRLKQIDNDGSVNYSDIVEVEVNSLPTEFTLSQNYPNPFNPSTVVSYQLPVMSFVTLELFAVTGEKVGTLVNGEQEAGYYNFELNSTKFNLSSGIYFYRLRAGEFVSTKKLILLK